MSFCEHCAGQRFDRAQVLRTLRATRQDLRASKAGRRVEEALTAAIAAVRALEIPHIPLEDDLPEGHTVH